MSFSSSSADILPLMSLPSSRLLARSRFVLVQLDDLFFDGVARHQPVDGHRALLADAVGAVGGLVFDGRVPPRVHVDHVVGGGQVEAQAAGLEADQEEIALAGLEGVHLAVLRSLGGVLPSR